MIFTDTPPEWESDYADTAIAAEPPPKTAADYANTLSASCQLMARLIFSLLIAELRRLAARLAFATDDASWQITPPAPLYFIAITLIRHWQPFIDRGHWPDLLRPRHASHTENSRMCRDEEVFIAWRPVYTHDYIETASWDGYCITELNNIHSFQVRFPFSQGQRMIVSFFSLIQATLHYWIDRMVFTPAKHLLNVLRWCWGEEAFSHWYWWPISPFSAAAFRCFQLRHTRRRFRH